MRNDATAKGDLVKIICGLPKVEESQVGPVHSKLVDKCQLRANSATFFKEEEGKDVS